MEIFFSFLGLIRVNYLASCLESPESPTICLKSSSPRIFESLGPRVFESSSLVYVLIYSFGQIRSRVAGDNSTKLEWCLIQRGKITSFGLCFTTISICHLGPDLPEASGPVFESSLRCTDRGHGSRDISWFEVRCKPLCSSTCLSWQ